jgi:hypothetical protein
MPVRAPIEEANSVRRLRRHMASTIVHVEYSTLFADSAGHCALDRIEAAVAG